MVFSPDGRRLASASLDRTVKIWDATTGQEYVTLKGHTSWVQGVAYSSDGRGLASASWDRTLKIWDPATGQNLLTLRGHTRGVLGVVFSPDGRHLASASQDQTVKIWDAATGQEILTLKGHADSVLGLAYSPDGRHLASASQDRTAKIWDAATGQEVLTLKGHTGPVFGVAYSPDGRHLASASQDRSIRIWGAATGQEILALTGHAERIKGVAYSPDGRRLASAGSWDGTVKIWDAATGQETLTVQGHANFVNGIAFSPDGRRLASASQDQTVKIWDATDLTPQLLIEREARGLVQFLIAKLPSSDEVTATIRQDRTITEAVRQQALTWVEPFWRSQVLNEVAPLVQQLFTKLMLRSDVLAAIRGDASLSEAVRQEALKLAETLQENASALNGRSWTVVRRPGADAAAYQLALRQAEAACRLAPNVPGYINTLGVAYYRVGKYAEAVAALEKCLPEHGSKGIEAYDLYFLAVCHHQLGNAATAQECFERAKDSHQRNAARLTKAQSEELNQFRKEAETLLEKPTSRARRVEWMVSTRGVP
jgi:WD40 repeat protein